MKLVLAVVQGKDSDPLLTALNRRGFRATLIESAGGFLRERNATLLIGVQDEYVEEVRQIIRENSHTRRGFVNPLMPIVEPAEFHVPSPVEVVIGGATVFVLNVERFFRIGMGA